MEYVANVKDSVPEVKNNGQASNQLFTVGDGWSAESSTVWILYRLAVNVFGIREEAFFDQLPKLTERLKYSCVLSGSERKANDQQLKSDVKKEIKNCQDLIEKINKWIEEINLKSNNINNSLQITLNKMHREYSKDISNSHLVKDKKDIIEDNILLIQASNRQKADNNKKECKAITIDTFIRSHDFSKSENQNKKSQYNYEKEQLNLIIESYHEDTKEFENLISTLRSELQNLKTAQLNLKNLFNPLYEKIHPTEGLAIWSYCPDHLHLFKSTDLFNLINENISNCAEAIEPDSEINAKIRSSTIKERLAFMDNTEEYKKFMKVFNEKLLEANIDVNDFKRAMVHVYYWEKIPETSKKMRDLSLKAFTKDLICEGNCIDDPEREFKSIWDKLIAETKQITASYQIEIPDEKRKCLIEVQTLFLKISKERIDPYHENVEKVNKYLQDFFGELIERPIRTQLFPGALKLFSNIFMQSETALQKHVTDFDSLKIKLSKLQKELSKSTELFYKNLESYKKEYLGKWKSLNAELPMSRIPNVLPITQIQKKQDKKRPEIDLIELKAFILLDFVERVLGLNELEFAKRMLFQNEAEFIPSYNGLINRLQHWRPLLGAKQKRSDNELKNRCSIVISQITTIEASLKKWRQEISKITKKIKESPVAKDLYFYSLAAIQKGYLQLMENHHDLFATGINQLITSLESRINSVEKNRLHPTDITYLVKRFDITTEEINKHVDSINTHTEVFTRLRDTILSKKSSFEDIKYFAWAEKLGETSLFEKEFNDLYELLNNAEFPEGLLSYHEENNSSEKRNLLRCINIKEKHLTKDTIDLKPNSYSDEIEKPKLKKAHLIIQTNQKSKEYTPNISKVLRTMTSKTSVAHSDHEEKIAKIKKGELYKMLKDNEALFNDFYLAVENLKDVSDSLPSFSAANVDDCIRCYKENQSVEKIPETLQVETAISMKAKVQKISDHITNISESVVIWINEINQCSDPLLEEIQYNDTSITKIDLNKLREFQEKFAEISKQSLQFVLDSIEKVNEWLRVRTNAESQLKLSQSGEKFVIAFFDQNLISLQQLDQSFELDSGVFNEHKLSLPKKFSELQTILANFETTFNATFWKLLYPEGGFSAMVQSYCMNPLKTPNILESYPAKNRG